MDSLLGYSFQARMRRISAAATPESAFVFPESPSDRSRRHTHRLYNRCSVCPGTCWHETVKYGLSKKELRRRYWLGHLPWPCHSISITQSRESNSIDLSIKSEDLIATFGLPFFKMISILFLSNALSNQVIKWDVEIYQSVHSLQTFLESLKKVNERKLEVMRTCMTVMTGNRRNNWKWFYNFFSEGKWGNYNNKKGLVMKYNCRQTDFSAGIPPVCVCLGTVSAFQLSDSSFAGKLTGEPVRSDRAELSITTHIYITASTHLSQGHVIMIPLCEWVSHAAGVYVFVWRMV